MKKNLILFCLTICLFSCSTGSDKVRVFFVDSGKLQYFLPNQTWISTEGTLKLDGDFLYRSYPLDSEDESKTIFNFTLSSDDSSLIHRNPPSTIILSEGMESRVWFNDIDMLFADRNKIRYTCWTSSREFSRYMNSTRQPVLTVQTDTGDFILEPEGTGFSEQISYFQTVDPSFE